MMAVVVLLLFVVASILIRSHLCDDTRSETHESNRIMMIALCRLVVRRNAFVMTQPPRARWLNHFLQLGDNVCKFDGYDYGGCGLY